MMKWKYCLICFLLLGLPAFVVPIIGEQIAKDEVTLSPNREIHDLVETLREEQLLHELSLDGERSDPFLKNIRAGRQLKNSYLLQKYLIENELDALLNYPSPNQDDISTALQRLEFARFQYYQALLKNERELRQLLTPEEQARYLLFQRQFNNRLKELIVKIRQQTAKSPEQSHQILRQQPQESVIRKPR